MWLLGWGPPDPGGYPTLQPYPVSCTVSRVLSSTSAARRGARHVSFTATVTLGRLQPPGIAKSLIKDTHPTRPCLHVCPHKGRLAGLAAYCPQQQHQQRCVVTYSAGPHTMSHRIHHSAALDCAPSSPIILVRSCGQGTARQCRIVPMYYDILSHRIPLAKRNACGTKRYGVVACQPAPNPMQVIQYTPAVRHRPPAQPWAAQGSPGTRPACRARVDRHAWCLLGRPQPGTTTLPRISHQPFR